MTVSEEVQCRKTLAILAELKNPKRPTFIRQQNNAINQQVNNQSESHSQKNQKVTNELLNEVNHAALDHNRTAETIRVNPKMETLEPIDRT